MTDTLTNLEACLEEAVKQISDAHRIVVFAHVNPDADAIGSIVGLVGGLRALGKDAVGVLNDPVPDYAQFLFGAADVRDSLPDETPDLYIFLDSAGIDRVGDVYLDQREAIDRATVLNIDHHRTNPAFGTHNYIDPAASSTSEMVYRVLTALGAPVGANLATALLFGVVGDTGSFQNGATTPGSLTVAADLLRLGADNQKVAFELFERKTYKAARLWGQILASTKLDARRGIAVAFLTAEMLEATGAQVAETEGVVEFLRGIEEAHMVMLLRETPEGQVRVSMRSRPEIDVAAIATALGGGGHRQAAGCTLAAPLESAQAELVAVYDRLYRA